MPLDAPRAVDGAHVLTYACPSSQQPGHMKLSASGIQWKDKSGYELRTPAFTRAFSTAGIGPCEGRHARSTASHRMASALSPSPSLPDRLLDPLSLFAPSDSHSPDHRAKDTVTLKSTDMSLLQWINIANAGMFSVINENGSTRFGGFRPAVRKAAPLARTTLQRSPRSHSVPQG